MQSEVLVTRAQADMVFGVLLILGIVVALVAFALARRRGGDGVRAAVLWGGPLMLIGVLWRVYNAITDRLGLDRVANLGVNLVLFVGVGAACGIGWTVLTHRKPPRIPEESNETVNP